MNSALSGNIKIACCFIKILYGSLMQGGAVSLQTASIRNAVTFQSSYNVAELIAQTCLVWAEIMIPHSISGAV